MSALCQKRTFDFFLENFFCAKIERAIFTNSVKVGLQSTSNIGSGSLPILVIPRPNMTLSWDTGGTLRDK